MGPMVVAIDEKRLPRLEKHADLAHHEIQNLWSMAIVLEIKTYQGTEANQKFILLITESTILPVFNLWSFT